ncbi:cytochrome ubiquinol oxidase subunit I [Nakamurella lactea]|uniref:cytochrome ubiquinol oxidase subunit I n=1 Tax=Nakamurella lactea TaxID=459515 RepID=UPI00040D219B|nr:cytochrome ubiquinol oxidase subunit I [Nakamurella lactea]
MDVLSLARWQFGVTTVYHYLFIPISIGLALYVAIVETAWVRTRNPVYLRSAKFFSSLLLINFAIGVVTGIVQEFQFGMNWSSYSRFVGDVFGAPLAMESLLAFFIESTFLGLWIFGWDKLSPRLHCACMWMVAFGTTASAYFILAANSFMQHPVGIEIDAATGRPRLVDIGAVLFQPLQLITFSHVITACWLTGAVVVVGVSSNFMAKRRSTEVFRPALRFGLWALLISSIAVIVTGDLQGKIMTEVQPMKMAAAEALYDTTDSASFSLITIGTLDGHHETWSIRVPGVTSYMATGTFDGTVEGVNDVQREYEQRFGPGDYRPNIPVTYWTFRLMMGAGFILALVSVVGLWLTRRGRNPVSPWVWRLAMWSVAGAFVGNTAGWVFTEMGRQPWTVVGLYKTQDSVSPTVTAGTVLTSLIVLTVLYGVLVVIETRLIFRTIRKGPPEEAAVLAMLGRKNPLRTNTLPDRGDDGTPAGGAGRGDAEPDRDDDVLTFAY